MQEMLLLCYTSIRFDTMGPSQITIIFLYCLILVLLLVDLNYHRIPYFKAKKQLNLVIFQRLVLPVMVLVPFNDTYGLVIFMLALAVV
jgi:hypothetical protein